MQFNRPRIYKCKPTIQGRFGNLDNKYITSTLINSTFYQKNNVIS